MDGSAEARPCGPEGRLLHCFWELARPSWHRFHLCLTQDPALQERPGKWGRGICPRPSCPGWAGAAPPPLGPQAPGLLPWGQRSHPPVLVPLASPLLPRLGQEKETGGLPWPRSGGMPSPASSLSTQRAHMPTPALCTRHQHQTQNTGAGTSLVVQRIRLRALNAGGPGSITGRGTRSCMHAATKKPACCN